MELSNIILFYITFLIVLFVAVAVFAFLQNKRVNGKIDLFLKDAASLQSSVFVNVNLQYRVINQYKMRVSPYGTSDLYLFDDALVLLRSQHFIFRLLFAPVLITVDPNKWSGRFGYIDIYKPDSIVFNRFLKGVIDIKLSDPKFKTFKIEVRLKKLTEEQMFQLDKMRDWC